MDREEFEEAVIDLTWSEAKELAEEHGYLIRPTCIGGVNQVITMDARPNRANVHLDDEDGTVTSFDSWG